MTALLFSLLVVCLACLVVSLSVNWWQSGEIDRLAEARHAKLRARAVEGGARPGGTAAASPAAAPGRPRTALIDHRSPAARHADAMFAASEPYLPEAPELPQAPWRPRQSMSRADLPPVRAQAPGAAPWDTETRAMPAADDEAVEFMRAQYVRSQLDERPGADPADLARVLAGLKRVPAEPASYLPEVAS